MFRVVEKGELSKKQRQALETMIRIVTAFYDDSALQKQARTWQELEKITGLSSGALSKHLKELIRQGVVTGHVEVRENKLTILYEATKKAIEIKGKTLEGARRIYKRYTIVLGK